MDQKIIEPIPVEVLEAELTPDKFLRTANKGGNNVYIVDAHNSPNVMREIGRLREIAFRAAGGGTGKECDIDEFDTMTPPCRQLIVWDPREREIIGGYRFITGDDIRIQPDGRPRLATSHMFNFSQRFLDEFLPYTLELGRSFVRLEYQSTRAGVNALYALDNLWDGLGALTVIYPQGKISLRQGDDVSELQRRMPQHDTLLPVEALPRQRFARDTDHAARHPHRHRGHGPGSSPAPHSRRTTRSSTRPYANTVTTYRRS